jgi:hypothetical protein
MFQDEGGASPGGVGGHNTLIRVKVVPGSRRDEVVGALGDRLKIKVSAPPEGGRANAAVCALIAERLGVSARAVSVVSGHGSAEKVVRVEGVGAGEVEGRLRG